MICNTLLSCLADRIGNRNNKTEKKNLLKQSLTGSIETELCDALFSLHKPLNTKKVKINGI